MHKTSKHVVIRTSIHQFAKPLMATLLASTFLVGEVMAAPGVALVESVDRPREGLVVEPPVTLSRQALLESNLREKYGDVRETRIADLLKARESRKAIDQGIYQAESAQLKNLENGFRKELDEISNAFLKSDARLEEHLDTIEKDTKTTDAEKMALLDEAQAAFDRTLEPHHELIERDFTGSIQSYEGKVKLASFTANALRAAEPETRRNEENALSEARNAIGATQNGEFAIATHARSTANGAGAEALANDTTAIGALARASASKATANGADSLASGVGSTAIGASTRATGEHSTAQGAYANASGIRSTATGSYADASGLNSTATGSFANAEGEGATASGAHANASGQDATATGSFADASGTQSTANGAYAKASGAFSTATGVNAEASGIHSTATGALAVASAIEATATGTSAQASGIRSTAFGANARALDQDASAHGVYADASGARSTSIGARSVASGEGSSATGYKAEAIGAAATAYGISSAANGLHSTALGAHSQALSDHATAAGYGANAAGIGSTANGTQAHAQGANSVAMGHSAHAQGAGAVALGSGAKAAENAVALGQGSVAEAGTVSVGKEGFERRVTNVANGTAPNDAINFSQFTGALGASRAEAVTASNRYTDQQVGAIRGEMRTMEKSINRGIASAAALVMATPYAPGKIAVNAGMAVYRGQAAGAIGASYWNTSGEWNVNGGVASAGGNSTIFRLGGSYLF